MMNNMRIDFTFSEDKVRELGHSLGDAYYGVKRFFEKENLPCIRDDEVLSFTDNGGKDDYANIWHIVLCLFGTDWFTKCATSCVFIEGDEEEDILAQAWKFELNATPEMVHRSTYSL